MVPAFGLPYSCRGGTGIGSPNVPLRRVNLLHVLIGGSALGKPESPFTK
jgi:hypothetical protein